MTDDTMPFLDALLKRGGGDFMKELAEEVLEINDAITVIVIGVAAFVLIIL